MAFSFSSRAVEKLGTMPIRLSIDHDNRLEEARLLGIVCCSA
jgi:hypothetical protein